MTTRASNSTKTVKNGQVRSSSGTNTGGKITAEPANGILKGAANRYLDQYTPKPTNGDIPTQFEQRGLMAEEKSNVVRSLREMGKAPRVSGSAAKTTGNKIRKVGMTRQAGKR